MNKTTRAKWRIFKIPLLIFFVSLLGLIAALLVDGYNDVVATLAVSVSVLVPLWYACQRPG